MKLLNKDNFKHNYVNDMIKVNNLKSFQNSLKNLIFYKIMLKH